MVRTTPLLFVLLTASFVPAQIDRARDDFNLAAGLYDRSLHDRAVKAFRQFLEKWPRNPRVPKARFYLGQSLVELNREQEALPHFQAYVASGERALRGEARLRAGELAHRLGRHAAATEVLDALLKERNPDRVTEAGLYFLGEAAVAAGNEKRGREAYERLVAAFARGSYAAYASQALGFLEFKAKQPQAALSHFSRARGAEDAELAMEARCMIGECLLELGKANEAHDAFAQARRGAQGSFAAQAGLGSARALLAMKKADEAVAEFTRVARAHPGDERVPGALIRAAATLHQTGKSPLGLRLLGQVRSAKGQDAQDLAYWRGLLMAETGSRGQAIEELKGALAKESGPGSLRRRYTLGDQLTKAGRLAEAAEVFSAIRKEAGDDEIGAEAAYAEAFVLNRLKKYDAAARVLESLTRRRVPDGLRRDGLFALAENLFALKRYDRARATYERLVEDSKGVHQESLYKSGWCAYLLSRHDDAIASFQRLLKLEPGPFHGEARYLIGKCHEAAGRHDQAQSTFAALGKSRGSGDLQVRARLGAAAAARKRGQNSAAIKSYADALRVAKDPLIKGDALLGMADLLLETGDGEEAEAAYRRLLTEVPKHPRLEEARLGRGWALRLMKRHEEAAGAARELAGQTKDVGRLGEALYLTGLSESARDRHGPAAEALQTLLQKCAKHPRTDEARLLLGISLARAGRHADAEPALARIAAGPKETKGRDTALYELAFCHDARKASDARDGVFERLLRDHPKSPFVPDVLFRLGEAAYAQKKWQQAAQRYAALCDHAGAGEFHDKAWYKRGWCARRQSQHPEAARAFEKVAAQKKSPLAGESWYLAGEDHLAAKAPAEALRCFAQVTKGFPNHELAAPAELQRILCTARLGRHDRVIQEAPAILARHGKRPRALRVRSALGDAFFAKKQWGRARVAFRNVTTASEGPLAARAQFHIGKSHQLEGQLDDAVDELLKVTILYAHPRWAARATLLAGDILAGKGLTDKARRLYQELKKSYGATPEAELVDERIQKLQRKEGK